MDKGTLIVISDTAVTKTDEGRWCGYEPVVKEIEYFLKMWSHVHWVACEYGQSKTVYSNPLKDNISVVGLKPIGGSRKTKIIWLYPRLFYSVFKAIQLSNDIHVRAPSHAALCAMIIALFSPKKLFWFKYAGSWIDTAPFTYRLQRNILKLISRNNIHTTINGEWGNSKGNIKTFENPCFSEENYIKAKINAKSASLVITKQYKLVYVGTLSEFKGVHLVIEALIKMKFRGIKSFTIIGTGEYERELKSMSRLSEYRDRIIFRGKENKDQVFKALHGSDVLIIPSQTEGFPKVISEAMLHGCVPMSTRISCIDQYVTTDVGYLIEERTVNGIISAIELALNDKHFIEKRNNCVERSSVFTYEHYVERISQEIFTA